MLHVICTQLHLGHLSVHVGEGSRYSEDIVKKSRIVPLNVIIIIKNKEKVLRERYILVMFIFV